MRAGVRRGIQGQRLVTAGLACASLVAASLAISAPVSATAFAPYGAVRATSPSPYVDVSLSEPPTAIAVADTGVIAASLFNPGSVAIIGTDGAVRLVSVNCRPSDVAINPAGTTAWAVCQDSTSLAVIDVTSGGVSVAPLDILGGDDVVYLPRSDRLYVASLEGRIIELLGVSSGNYELGAVIGTGDFRPTTLAVTPDGVEAYVATDAGALLWIDLVGRGYRVIANNPAARNFAALALDPSGRSLYAAVIDSLDPSAPRTSLELIDFLDGRALQSVPLDFTLAGSTAIEIAAGYRQIYVSAGLAVAVGSQETGLLAIPRSAQGRLGALSPLTASPGYGVALGLSPDRDRVAVATTQGEAQGLITDDEPYPTIDFEVRVRKDRLTLAGTSQGLSAGTAVTVWIKDMTKRKSRYVAQKAKATIGASGTYSWAGKVVSRRMSLYVTAGDAVSDTSEIRIGR